MDFNARFPAPFTIFEGMSSRELEVRRAVLVDALPGAWVRDAALVVGYACFVGVTAQVAIPLPFTPVPITGQTFGVLLGGMALGWRRGLLGMLLYTVAGLVGVPWFAQGNHGLSMLAAPSFGYIIGFIAAGLVVGRLAESGLDRKPHLTLLVMACGNLLIYAFGLAWLMAVLHVGIGKAAQLGLLPFLLGDAIKALLAAGLLPGAWKLTGAGR